MRAIASASAGRAGRQVTEAGTLGSCPGAALGERPGQGVPRRASRPFALGWPHGPANAGGERASLLLRAGATFPLARAVQSPAGAPLGEVFRFTSGLYFRGKVT